MFRLVGLTLLLTLVLGGAAQARDFPETFLWGPAISAFQTEAGGAPAKIVSPRPRTTPRDRGKIGW